MQDSSAIISAGLNGELTGRALDTKPCFSERTESRSKAKPAQSPLQSTALANSDPARITSAADEDCLSSPSHSNAEQTKDSDGISAKAVASSLSCEAATSKTTLSDQSPPGAQAAQLSEDSSRTLNVPLADREPLGKPLLSADFTVSFMRVSMLILHCLHLLIWRKSLHADHCNSSRVSFVQCIICRKV